MSEKLLKIADVVAKVSLGESTVWAKVKTGEFPAPVKLGPRSRGWRESDLERWIDARQSGQRWKTAPPPEGSATFVLIEQMSRPVRVSRANQTIIQAAQYLYEERFDKPTTEGSDDPTTRTKKLVKKAKKVQ